jgi:hypothetical protein
MGEVGEPGLAEAVGWLEEDEDLNEGEDEEGEEGEVVEGLGAEKEVRNTGGVLGNGQNLQPFCVTNVVFKI